MSRTRGTDRFFLAGRFAQWSGLAVLKISRKRWILVPLGSLLVLSAFLLLLSPLWIPPAARWAVKGSGLQWEEAEAVGFQRLVLQEVRFKGDGLTARLDRISVPQPLPWIAGLLGWRTLPVAEGGTLRIQMQRADPGQTANVPGPELLAPIHSALQSALPWLPVVTLEQLEQVNHPGRTVAALSGIQWNGRLISATVPASGPVPSFRLSAWIGEDTLRLAAVENGTSFALRAGMIAEPRAEGLRLSGEVVSRDVPLRFQAFLPAGQWVPQSASLETTRWPVPEVWKRSAQALPDKLLADLRFASNGPAFEADLDLRAPDPGTLSGTARLKLAGNLQQVWVNALHADLGWLKADLSDPVTYRYRDGTLSGETRFELVADLDAQDFLPAGGRLAARAHLKSLREGSPVASLEVSGTNLSVMDFQLHSAEASGSYRLESREMSFEGAFQLDPSGLLPAGFPGRLEGPAPGTFRISGDPADLQHAGTLEGVSLVTETLQRLNLSLDWQGRGMTDLQGSLALESGSGARLLLQGSIENPDTGEPRLEIRSLTHSGGGLPDLALAESIVLERATGTALPFTLSRPLVLAGPAMRLEAALEAEAGQLQLRAEALPSELAALWLLQPPPPFQLARLDLQIGLERPVLAGQIRLDMESRIVDESLGRFQLEGSFAADGMALDRVRAALDGVPFLEGRARIPATLSLGENGLVFAGLSGEPLQGAFNMEVDPELVMKFQDIPGIRHLGEARLDLSLGGTLKAPTGTLEARLSRSALLEALDSRFAGTDLRDLRLQLSLTPEYIEIAEAEARLGEGVLSATGRIPLNRIRAIGRAGREADWPALLEAADLDLEIRQLTARSVSGWIPGFMREDGRLAGRVRLRPGEPATGFLNLNGFGLRPTLALQTVEDIAASLDLKGRRLSLTGASARIGDGSLGMEGWIDFTEPRHPEYEITLASKQAPILRTPDLLIRADLDLQLSGGQPGSPGRIQGSVALQDSMLLLDLDPLAAKTAGQDFPSPPFFQVKEEPFSSWELDVTISGDKALRLRSQYARAEVSVQADLDGTLGQPVWTGNVFATEGYLDFPGARLSLSRSDIFVTLDRPASLQLDINATGRSASTILSLRVRGTARDPLVELATTPELSNARAFQLLATGSLQGGGADSLGLYLGRSLFGPSATANPLLDRLRVEVGRDLTESGQKTLDVYFRLTDSLRLHGEYDKYDAHNLDLEWEVFSR